jgi:hypothetical protein
MSILKRKKILSITVFVLLIILIIVIYFLSKNKALPPSPQEPTPTSYVPPQTNEEAFQLIKITPTPPVYITFLPEERVTLQFNSTIDQNSISYSIKPSLSTKIIYEDKNPNAFSIIPTTSVWEANIDYTFLVSKNLKSISGQTLKEDIVFSLRREEPEEFSPDSEHL